jgi:hypothetical protein
MKIYSPRPTTFPPKGLVRVPWPKKNGEITHEKEEYAKKAPLGIDENVFLIRVSGT